MFSTENHNPDLYPAGVDADAITIGNYGALGYGGHARRLDLPDNGPSECPSGYAFTYRNVAVVSADANELSYEIQGLPGYSQGEQAPWLPRKLAAFRADPDLAF